MDSGARILKQIEISKAFPLYFLRNDAIWPDLDLDLVFRRLQPRHVALQACSNGSGGFVLMKNNSPSILTRKFGRMFALHHENIDFRTNFEAKFEIWCQIWSFGGYSLAVWPCKPVSTVQGASYWWKITPLVSSRENSAACSLQSEKSDLGDELTDWW